MVGTYKYIHPLNCLIEIYYQNNVNEVVNINSLNLFINDIHENFRKYNSKIFDKLLIRIWDYRRSDIPDNLIMNVPGTNTQVITDIKDMAGETWGSLNFMQLNSHHTETDNKLALILSHETGHIIDYKTDTDQSDDIIMPEWKMIRGDTQKSIIDPKELYAEDILTCFGCRLAKGIHRGIQSDPRTVKGLKDMYLIWNPVFRFVTNIRQLGGKIENISHYYSDSDIDFYSIVFLANYNENQKYWYCVNRDGFWEWMKINNDYWDWKPIYKF